MESTLYFEFYDCNTFILRSNSTPTEIREFIKTYEYFKLACKAYTAWNRVLRTGILENSDNIFIHTLFKSPLVFQRVLAQVSTK